MKHRRVYNLFQINLIVFYAVSFLLVPVFIVFAYMFNLHLYTSTNYIVLIATIVAMIFFVVGLLTILLTREKTERVLKPSYSREFIIVIVFSSFGVIGFGIFYTYLGGNFFYVPHVIIPLFITVFSVVIFLGNKFFKVDII